MFYLLSLSIGIVAGLRAMTAPAAVSWAAYLGWLKLDESILAFMGYAWTPWVITVLAVAELVTDQLPSTPSRTVPVQFGTRILSGALTGAALGIVAGSLVIGAVLGAAGAVIGTLGGRAARAALGRKFGNDRPAALLEDVVAIAAALLIVRAFL
jgi:Predicted membrane protein